MTVVPMLKGSEVYKHNIYILYIVLQNRNRENIIQDRNINHVYRNYTMQAQNVY